MHRGDPAEAARQLASADLLRAEIQAAVPAAERAEREQTVRAAQQALGTAYGLAGLTAGLNGSGDQDAGSVDSASVRGLGAWIPR
jgi:hypothetical protein